MVGIRRVLEHLKRKGKISIEIKRDKPTKSLRGMLWKLCQKLAVYMSQQGIVVTKTDIYREAVKECMEWDEVSVPNKAVDKFCRLWKSNGLGYCTEVVEQDDTNTLIFCYYGSSTYDSVQLCRLVDYVKCECKSLGVEE